MDNLLNELEALKSNLDNLPIEKIELMLIMALQDKVHYTLLE